MSRSVVSNGQHLELRPSCHPMGHRVVSTSNGDGGLRSANQMIRARDILSAVDEGIGTGLPPINLNSFFRTKSLVVSFIRWQSSPIQGSHSVKLQEHQYISLHKTHNNDTAFPCSVLRSNEGVTISHPHVLWKLIFVLPKPRNMASLYYHLKFAETRRKKQNKKTQLMTSIAQLCQI